MKKFYFFLCFILIFLTSCNSEKEKNTYASDYAVAMITDAGEVTDSSFNQFTYEACRDFCKKHNIRFSYFKPISAGLPNIVSVIDVAIAKGFNVIVTPGFLFVNPLKEVLPLYPDIKFINLDNAPENFGFKDNIPQNLSLSVFEDTIGGFLVGYAAVALGYKHIAFLGGMAIPSIMRFGSGYIQGAESAAKEKKIDGISLEYVYANQFFGDADITSYMDAWFQEKGVKAVFVAGGRIWTSVAEAASKPGVDTKIIGVDVDQSPFINAYKPELTVTSSVKSLGSAVTTILENTILHNNWKQFSGKMSQWGLITDQELEKNYLQLPLSTQWNDSFSFHDYKNLVSRILHKEIQIDSSGKEPKTKKINVHYWGAIK